MRVLRQGKLCLALLRGAVDMRFYRGWVLLLVCGLVWGCGGADDPGNGNSRPEGSHPRGPDFNNAPQVNRLTFQPRSPTPGGSVTVLVDHTDLDGDSVKLGYAWKINGRGVDSSNEILDLSGRKRGDRIEVRVTPSDGKATGDAKTASVRLGNQAPVLKGIRIAFSDDKGESGVLVATPIATDPERDELEFTYQWSVGDREVSGDGESFDTSEFKRGDTFRVTVVATDGEAESEPITSEPITMPNRDPKIVSKPPQIDENGLFNYKIKAEDADGDRMLRYSLSRGPDGMSVDSLFGSVTWKPTYDDAGTHDIIVAVKDGKGGVAMQQFQLVVTVSGDDPGEASKEDASNPREDAGQDEGLAEETDEEPRDEAPQRNRSFSGNDPDDEDAEPEEAPQRNRSFSGNDPDDEDAEPEEAPQRSTSF